MHKFTLKQHEYDLTTYAVFCNAYFAIMTNCRIKILGYRCKPSHALNDEYTVHLMCIYLLTMCYNPKQTPPFQKARKKLRYIIYRKSAFPTIRNSSVSTTCCVSVRGKVPLGLALELLCFHLGWHDSVMDHVRPINSIDRRHPGGG